MKALHLYAGTKARAHIAQHGLRPEHVGVIPGAAGGPKGLILGPLDRFIFGEWLPQSTQRIDLIGASIGAWRMATACLNQAVAGFERLEHDYIQQRYEPPPGQKRLSPQQVSEAFRHSLQAFYEGHMAEVLNHPRYRLHVMTSHGRHLLHREHAWLTPIGYAGAYVCNAVRRKAMGWWLDRVVFSSPHKSAQSTRHGLDLPFGSNDFATQQVALTEINFMPALQASCSIPFVLQAVHDIPGAPRGAYWDGGITDYHLHLNYTPPSTSPIVLYPHFQQAVVPGWLDKALKWRHRSSAFLDHAVVLAPNPEWVRTLPNGKLPDRSDFVTYAHDFNTRVKVWQQAASASQQLADELAAWLDKPDVQSVQPL
jgi:hypothetical protein